jgi:hypothetical protein
MDRMTYFYIGVIPTFVLYMLVCHKKLRSDRFIRYLALITFGFAVSGIVIRVPESAFFASAFIYLISYAVLRKFYINKYKVEPTYNRSSWYDPEEGRQQNGLDVITFVAPIFLSFILSLALSIAKSKGLLF